jgi:RHS repeat-associated protein
VLALTDASGEIDTSYTYDPFGTATEAGEKGDNPFQFTGRENDGTGLQYNRARYYEPSNGRFISQDPAGFAGSGPNLYWYANGSPLDITDPTGETGLPSIPNPVSVVEGTVNDAVSDAANNVEESAEFVGDHKGEFAGGVSRRSLYRRLRWNLHGGERSRFRSWYLGECSCQ